MISTLPQFLRDLLASPPSAGEGVHNWLFRVARHLHVHYLDKAEMVRLLAGATEECGRLVSRQEIEDAIRNSQSVAWRPTFGGGQSKPPKLKWPDVDLAAIEKLARAGLGLVELWEA